MSEDLPEIRLRPGLSPEPYAEQYARHKFVQIPDIFEPALAHAIEQMLTRLSGRNHTVFTGFTLSCVSAAKTSSQCIATSVKFKDLTPAEIEWYIGTSEPFDKAGAYAIQGLGTFLEIKR